MIKHAIIKLVTGEELFSQVEEFVDGKDKSIILIDPAIIKEIPNRKGPFNMYKIEPWLKLTDEKMFCLDLTNVVYYAHCKDDEKITTYTRWLKSETKGSDKSDSRVGITSSLGFICTVKQSRESLEKLFNES